MIKSRAGSMVAETPPIVARQRPPIVARQRPGIVARLRPPIVARAAMLLLLVVVGCRRDRAVDGYGRVSDDNHELRQAFDADVDRVRLILLVSPS